MVINVKEGEALIINYNLNENSREEVKDKFFKNLQDNIPGFLGEMKNLLLIIWRRTIINFRGILLNWSFNFNFNKVICKFVLF